MKDIIIHGDCFDVLKTIEDKSIDLTVTSPPYDNLRTYNGYSFNFEGIAKELYRVTKDGGVVVWVVGDAVEKGSETGTSFKQALFFKELGFNIHDTMIYEKNSSTFPARVTDNRYTQIFEYMFVFSKGKPKGKLICDKRNAEAGKNYGVRQTFGGKEYIVPEFSPRTNIWKFVTSLDSSKFHPAMFPESLARDHILTWSEEGDTVLDPFAGGGTTPKVAKETGRHYIGIEISEEYINKIKQRLL